MDETGAGAVVAGHFALPLIPLMIAFGLLAGSMRKRSGMPLAFYLASFVVSWIGAAAVSMTGALLFLGGEGQGLLLILTVVLSAGVSLVAAHRLNELRQEISSSKAGVLMREAGSWAGLTLLMAIWASLSLGLAFGVMEGGLALGLPRSVAGPCGVFVGMFWPYMFGLVWGKLSRPKASDGR